MMSQFRIWPLVLLGLLVCAAVATPVLLIWRGTVASRRDRSAAAWLMIGTGSVLGLLVAATIGWVVDVMGPWHEGVLAHGTSPERREYCVVQSWQSIVEPYRVDFYIRDAAGRWRWNYLEHEGLAWKSAQVEFSKGKAFVLRNGKPFREVDLPTDAVVLASPSGGYPASFSVDDILELHGVGRR